MDDAAARGEFRAAVKVGIPIAVSSFLLALTFGATARANGWGVLAPTVASLLVFSGSAQYALLGALSSGAGAVSGIGTAALINARFIPMSLAIGPWLAGGRLRRSLEGLAIVDASWVLAHQGGGRFSRLTLLGTTAPQYPAWVTGTLIGALAAPSGRLFDELGLDVIYPAFFLLLLIDELAERRSGMPIALAAALLTGALVFVAPPGVAVLACGLVALTGLRRRVEGAVA